MLEVFPTRIMTGGSSEPISEVVTHDLAQSVMRNLGAELQVPGVAQRNCGEGGGCGESVSRSKRGVR